MGYFFSNVIKEIALQLRQKWKSFLDQNIVNNEQMNLLFVYFDDPNRFCLKSIENHSYLKEVLKFLAK